MSVLSSRPCFKIGDHGVAPYVLVLPAHYFSCVADHCFVIVPLCLSCFLETQPSKGPQDNQLIPKPCQSLLSFENFPYQIPPTWGSIRMPEMISQRLVPRSGHCHAVFVRTHWHRKVRFTVAQYVGKSRMIQPIATITTTLRG